MPACLIAGVLLAQLFNTLPPTWLVYSLASCSLVLLWRPRWRWLALLLLACCWSLANFQTRLDSRLGASLIGEVIQVNGVISSIPAPGEEFVRFLFATDQQERSKGLPETLLVHWYQDWPGLGAGEHWRLELKLKPPWGRVNFQGADKERWLFASGIGGLATVRSGSRLPDNHTFQYPLNQVRENVLQAIAQSLSDQRERGVVQALATADRSGLGDEDRRLLTATGTSHLLAISGLHVGLAAAGGLWLSRVLLLFLPLSGIGSASLLISVSGGLLAAVAYAALAGFGTPTLRSVLMLCAVMAAVLLSRAIHPMRAWVTSLAVILLLDPFALLGAGLWFTFLAVAALMYVFAPRMGKLAWWKTLLLAQSSVILVLLPVSAGWFFSFSPAGFFANLLAIPWVSLLVVPLVLSGLTALPFSSALAGALWSAAGLASTALFYFLQLIDRLQGQLATLAPPSALQLVLAFLGAFVLLLPRGLPARWLGVFLLIPLFLPPDPRIKEGAIEMEVLDAGQGTAVLVSSAGRTLLYDSGPGDGKERNLVAGVIAPALARLGSKTLSRVVISHGDMDHAGGLETLLKWYPGAEYFANLPHAPGAVEPCLQHMSWDWPGIAFKALHPTSGLPYMGNNSSCVISVRLADNQLLLSGDISELVENRLVMDGLPAHKVLLVPHHGSKTSSSPAFLEQVNPQVAIATASLGNRFGFPRPEIRRRYEKLGIEFWSTGECGALRLELDHDGLITASSARRQRKRIWRWPVGENCP